MRKVWFVFILVARYALPLEAAAPAIQFEQLVYDFGKVTGFQVATGAFKFKNIGDAVLKLNQPTTSCGCAVAALKDDELNPGDTGEVNFTLDLGYTKSLLERQITVASNDPKTPQAVLTVKADYTPLYEVDPLSTAVDVARGTTGTNFFITIERTDGKSIRLNQVHSSKPWIKLALERSPNANASTARINVEVKPDAPPGQYLETISIYGGEQTNESISIVNVLCQVNPEVTVNPQMIHWRIADRAQWKKEDSKGLLTRRVSVRLSNGKPFELKDLRSSIESVTTRLIPSKDRTAYEIVAILSRVPEATVTGNVSFQTSAEPSRVKVPVTIAVVWNPPVTNSASTTAPRPVSFK